MAHPTLLVLDIHIIHHWDLEPPHHSKLYSSALASRLSPVASRLYLAAMSTSTPTMLPKLPGYAESMLKAIPEYACPPEKLANPHVHRVSKSADKVNIAPKLEKRDASYYVKIALDAIDANKSSLEPVSDDKIARKDRVLRHMSEEDVLATPVTGTKSSRREIASAAKQTLTFTDQATGEEISLRPDSSYYRVIGDIFPFLDGGKVGEKLMTRVFAIGELKDRGSLPADEFETLSRPPPRAIPNTAQGRMFQQLMQQGGNARLKPYSTIATRLLKQSTAYALAHRTQYVFIFDWDTLILIVFDKLPTKAGIQTDELWKLGVLSSGNSATITVVRDKTIIRSSLLGHLKEAYEQTPVDRKNGA
ncbi:hypothetical protein CMUS01_02499 [Colletotrichum musicola]|uniref:Uncharacterized protein n=1 Tax=Colletotrichum musicola TaxID=2175873 RepID=A0A8H6NV28_9PEZI|nr:hypothetical protein CMUS01_02499 [Colletotrichum musicola]